MTTPDHFHLETEVHELFAVKFRAFAEFCAKNWLMADGEALTLAIPTSCATEYERGYNDAMSSGLQDALDHWLDESGYAR